MDDYVEIDERLSKLVRWNNLWNGGVPEKFTDKQMQKVCKVVDDGYAVLGAACQSNLRKWGLMFVMYMEDNNGKFLSGLVNNSTQKMSAKFYGRKSALDYLSVQKGLRE